MERAKEKLMIMMMIIIITIIIQMKIENRKNDIHIFKCTLSFFVFCFSGPTNNNDNNIFHMDRQSLRQKFIIFFFSPITFSQNEFVRKKICLIDACVCVCEG